MSPYTTPILPSVSPQKLDLRRPLIGTAAACGLAATVVGIAPQRTEKERRVISSVSGRQHATAQEVPGRLANSEQRIAKDRADTIRYSLLIRYTRIRTGHAKCSSGSSFFQQSVPLRRAAPSISRSRSRLPRKQKSWALLMRARLR